MQLILVGAATVSFAIREWSTGAVLVVLAVVNAVTTPGCSPSSTSNWGR